MKRLEPEVEREVRRLAAKGHRLREIGRILGCSRHAVTNTLRRQPRPPSPTAWNPSPSRLSLHEREEIRVGLERGVTFTAIATTIGRAVSTVSREIKANGGRDSYRGGPLQRNQQTSFRGPLSLRLPLPTESNRQIVLLFFAASPSPAARRPYRSIPRALFNCLGDNHFRD